MNVGDLVQANKFANWSARQANFGFVLSSPFKVNFDVDLSRVLLGGDVKVLPASHFEVVSESR
mgnify:CR=1 FL=1